MSFCKWNVLISKKIANPEIPGLGRRQSRDAGLTKRAGIPGLETLVFESDKLEFSLRGVKSKKISNQIYVSMPRALSKLIKHLRLCYKYLMMWCILIFSICFHSAFQITVSCLLLVYM